jgi:hypothetical protein
MSANASTGLRAGSARTLFHPSRAREPSNRPAVGQSSWTALTRPLYPADPDRKGTPRSSCRDPRPVRQPLVLGGVRPALVPGVSSGQAQQHRAHKREEVAVAQEEPQRGHVGGGASNRPSFALLFDLSSFRTFALIMHQRGRSAPTTPSPIAISRKICRSTQLGYFSPVSTTDRNVCWWYAHFCPHSSPATGPSAP